ncbi:MAG: flagellar type III secretion system pore protein FliP, partial [Clostridiales bacterium]|nr:flagellar type III secretion system pore protein FliP [Clostridiales bacterium]
MGKRTYYRFRFQNYMHQKAFRGDGLSLADAAEARTKGFVPKGFVSRAVKIMLFLAVLVMLHCFFMAEAQAVELPVPNLDINIGAADTPQQATSSLQLLLVISIISLSPFILLMLTCFTRLIIALHFLRSALGTQQMPPNQVLIGLALFLTFFIMSPTLSTINETAIEPFSAGQITQTEAIDAGLKPLRSFMIRQVEKKDLALFASLANETYATTEEIPNTVLIPSFILGEVSKGFRFGFFIYMPFIVVDMVVSSTL